MPSRGPGSIKANDTVQDVREGAHHPPRHEERRRSGSRLPLSPQDPTRLQASHVVAHDQGVCAGRIADVSEPQSAGHLPLIGNVERVNGRLTEVGKDATEDHLQDSPIVVCGHHLRTRRPPLF